MTLFHVSSHQMVFYNIYTLSQLSQWLLSSMTYVSSMLRIAIYTIPHTAFNRMLHITLYGNPHIVTHRMLHTSIHTKLHTAVQRMLLIAIHIIVHTAIITLLKLYMSFTKIFLFFLLNWWLKCISLWFFTLLFFSFFLQAGKMLTVWN